MSLQVQDFDFVRKLVRERSGIVLDESKGYLVESRLAPVCRTLGYKSIGELVAAVRGRAFSREHKAIVEAMTTNETSFFRDLHPFETLQRHILPDLIERRSSVRKLNIWCAACSSGQEPYSLAMLIREQFPRLASWKVNILATDISTETLERARAGLYSQVEINRGLPAPLLVKYFEQDGLAWRLKQDLRSMVEFRELNLTAALPPMPAMDLVLIRNVLIYFDLETKKGVLAKIGRVLDKDGYLLLGGAETTINVDVSFARRAFGKTVCYRKEGAQQPEGAKP